MSSITYLGTGAGLIYITDPSNTITYTTLSNIPDSVRAAIKETLASTPAISGTRGAFKIVISAVAAPGNILTLTVNGVSQITAPVVGVVGDPEATATALASNINATVGVPDYTAQAVGNTVYVFYESIGDTPNGDVVAMTADAPITFVADGTVEGGSNAIDGVSPSWGRRIWLDTAGVVGAISGTDITSELLSTFFGRPQAVQSVTDGSGGISVNRDGSTTYVEVDSTGVLAQIGQITMANATDGDKVIVWGKQAANSIEIVDVVATVGSVPNIYTSGQSVFDSEGASDAMTLMYINDATLGYGWFEISRSNSQPITVTDIRNAGIPEPIVGTVTQAVNFAGGTFTATPGTTKGTIRLTGTGNLAANYTVTAGGSPIAGETWIVQGYGSAVTYAGGSLIVFGRTIPSQSALSGNWEAIAIWDDVSSSYRCTVMASVDDSSWVMNSMIDEVDGAKITAASIPAGTYGASSIDGTTDIANGSIPSSKLDATTQAALSAISEVLAVKVTVPTASVLTMFATPITLVGAQGGGTVIEAVSCFMRAVYSGVTYATNLNLEVACDGATTAQFSGNGSLGFAANRILSLQRTAGVVGSVQMIENTDLVVRVPTGNPTLGNSDIDFYVLYRVVTL